MANVLVNAEDFSLFGGDLASHEVANCEGEQIGRRRPVGVACKFAAFVETTGYVDQSVDEPIEICNEVAMKTIQHLYRISSAYLL